MKAYKLKNCYHSQVEGNALVNIRFGFTCFGIAYPHKFWKKKRTDFWWIPRLSFEFWAHTGQCAQRWIFRFTMLNKRFGYRTKGDSTPSLSSYYDAGWQLN
jgi:hypothetical protein